MSKKYRCPFCPDCFSTTDKYDQHFSMFHRLDRISGRLQGYKPPLPYTRPPRQRPPIKDDLDGLFSWGNQSDFDEDTPPPPTPPISPFS